jgi:CheY-like chemotaxis protein
VLEAQNGGEAIMTCEKHVGIIDLVLTDVVMPQMSGRELVGRLVTIRSDLRVLYMSGYTEDAILRHGIVDAGVELLQKPLTPSALLRKVRAVLDRT